MTRRLTVELGNRSYPIVVGSGVLADASLFEPYIAGPQICIVTNETVAPLYLEQLHTTLGNRDVDVCILPDGEEHKTLATYATVLEHLLTHRHNRTTTLVALGGGVIGDVAGFCRSHIPARRWFHTGTDDVARAGRFVSWRQNRSEPRARQEHDWSVLSAATRRRGSDTLMTLGTRDYLCGIAEIIKYGVIRDGSSSNGSKTMSSRYGSVMSLR